MCRRLLCYGDSNTYGYDPRSYLGGRYPQSVRWTALLREYGWDVINRGENGRSIPCGDGEIHAAIQSLCRVEADILTVMLGSNDLLQPSCPPARECADRMERFLTALLHADGWDKSRKILLVAPPPMALGNWVQDEKTIAASHSLAGYYEDIARLLNISFADAGGLGIDLAYDGVHFSEMGHLTFAKGIQQVLTVLASKDCGN